MREYELIYVIQPDATPEREAEIHERVDGVISAAGSRVLLRDDWGKRRLAYEIKKFQKGHYFQLNFLSEGKDIEEIERLLRLDADMLRFLSILAEEEVKDIDTRVAEAAKEAEEQARRRELREKEREQREKEEALRAASEGAPRNDDDDDDADRRPARPVEPVAAVADDDREAAEPASEA